MENAEAHDLSENFCTARLPRTLPTTASRIPGQCTGSGEPATMRLTTAFTDRL